MLIRPLMIMPTPERAPPDWTGAWVRGRLREAYEIERRLPRDRRANGGGNGWPAIVHTFTDMVGWTDVRERVWSEWARAKGAYPWEVSRMEEAFGWLAILLDRPDERRCLVLWAKTTGSIRDAVRRRRWPRSTFYRGVVSGSERIAGVLNAQGSKVR